MSAIVKQYNDEYIEDCFFDEDTLLEKIEKISSVTHKWSFRVFQHRTRVKALENKKINLAINAEISFKERDDPALNFNNKSDAGKKIIISKTDTIREIDKKISEEELVLFFVEEILNNCKFTLNKALTNAVEFLKYQAHN